MKLAAIIPVKTFANAKMRLKLPAQKKSRLCEIMLDEVVRTATTSPHIDATILVTREKKAEEIANMHGAEIIAEKSEDGVNAAVRLADRHLLEKGFAASVVLPQDIPYIKTQDIDFMLNYKMHPDFAVIVPSRRFDGTNALVRMPVDLMETHYDEDSYKIHMSVAKSRTLNVAMVFVKRIMWDVDNMDDLEFLLENPAKPDLAQKIKEILD